MKIKFILFVTAAIFLSGCATPNLTLNYAPSSTMTVEGEMNVGSFRYLPGENGKVKPNQIRNTAFGSVLFEKDINKYMETALFTESRFVGIKMKETGVNVSGEIIEFLIDDLGFSIDWTLEVRYLIEGCYNEVHTLEKKTEKFGNVFGSLNEVIKLNIEKLFADKAFQACINNGPVTQQKASSVSDGDKGVGAAIVTLPVVKNVTSSDKEIDSVSSSYPDVIKDLNSDSAIEMQRAAKRVGEEKLYTDEGVILASIAVLERALKSDIDKKEKYKIDGLSWCALNLGNAKDERASRVLADVMASHLPKKLRSHAAHALKTMRREK